MVDYKLNGKLKMTDDQTGEFEIVTDTGIAFNVSRIINNVFESSLRPQIYVRVSKCGRVLFEESGGLFLNIDKQKVESFFICGLNLSKLLWDNTDEFLEIIIKKEDKI